MASDQWTSAPQRPRWIIWWMIIAHVAIGLVVACALLTSPEYSDSIVLPLTFSGVVCGQVSLLGIKETKGMPIQGVFAGDLEGFVELQEEYVPGLKDLEAFSHAILIYYFHQSDGEQVTGRPFLEDDEHGIFAIRSPFRPNHIGLSVVRIESIEASRLRFTQVDILDGTPLLDIKPYVRHFDCREDARCGWIDRHFEDGKPPKRIVVS